MINDPCPIFNDRRQVTNAMFDPIIRLLSHGLCHLSSVFRPLATIPYPLSTVACGSWAVYTLIYAAGYCFISLTIYLILPWATRMLAAKLLDGMGEVVTADLKNRSRELLHKGREYAMSSPQSSIVGHLVEPYLERLSDWMLEKMNQYQGEKLGRRCADMSVERLRRCRLTVSLAIAQATMTLLAIGYLIRGVY
jgi:hypothetical protein